MKYSCFYGNAVPVSILSGSSHLRKTYIRTRTFSTYSFMQISSGRPEPGVGSEPKTFRANDISRPLISKRYSIYQQAFASNERPAPSVPSLSHSPLFGSAKKAPIGEPLREFFRLASLVEKRAREIL